jgi:hypothetical protein
MLKFSERQTKDDSSFLKKCSELSTAIQQIDNDKVLGNWARVDLNSTRLKAFVDQQIAEAEPSEFEYSMSSHGSSGLDSSCSEETTLSPPLDDFENISLSRESYLQCPNWVSQSKNKGRMSLEPVST